MHWKFINVDALAPHSLGEGSEKRWGVGWIGEGFYQSPIAPMQCSTLLRNNLHIDSIYLQDCQLMKLIVQLKMDNSADIRK